MVGARWALTIFLEAIAAIIADYRKKYARPVIIPAMRNEHEQFIPEIQELPGLTQVSDDLKENLANTFGDEFLRPPTKQEIAAVKGYVHSPIKKAVDRFTGLIITVAGKPIEWPSAAIVKYFVDKTRVAYFSESIGFPGFPPTAEHKKIRTMRDGAHDERKTFGASAFWGTRVGDDRIIDHWVARFLRKTGFDEIPQFWPAARGKLSTVGIRGYFNYERKGLKILRELRDDERLGLKEEVKEILTLHPHLIAEICPRPACFSLLSAFGTKGISDRLYLDTKYLQWANPKVDYMIFWATVSKRLVPRVK